MNITLDFPDDVDGLALSGIQRIKVQATPVPLSYEIYIDNTRVGLLENPGNSAYTYNWDTTKFSEGTHLIRAEAVYKSRRQRTQSAVTVRQSVIVVPPPPDPTEFSDRRYVYSVGDSLFGGHTGWKYGSTSHGWIAQWGTQDPTLLRERIRFTDDDGVLLPLNPVPYFAPLAPVQGIPDSGEAIKGVPHNIKSTYLGTDLVSGLSQYASDAAVIALGGGGSRANGSMWGVGPYSDPAWGFDQKTHPHPQPNEDWWYSYPIRVNRGFSPYNYDWSDMVFGNWNVYGLELHTTFTGAGAQGSVATGLATIQGTKKYTMVGSDIESSAFYFKNYDGPMERTNPWRWHIIIRGGDINNKGGVNDINHDDADSVGLNGNTNRTYMGPEFYDTSFYHFMYRIKFSGYRNGLFEWYAKKDNEPWKCWAKDINIATIWRNNTYQDQGTYPQLQNYAKHWPDNRNYGERSVIYSGFVRGLGKTDVQYV